MKRTLFNTMMGCLAALSLAGCGGSDSGGGSSTVPSESLISEGYSLVQLSYHPDGDGDTRANIYRLWADGTCQFIPHYPYEISFKGRWEAKYLGPGDTPGSGKFLITFYGVSKDVNSKSWDCVDIPSTQEITLNITDMSKYRAGWNSVAASFDKAPFTHKAEAGTKCPDTALAVGTELKLIMLSGISSGSSGSDL